VLGHAPLAEPHWLLARLYVIRCLEDTASAAGMVRDVQFLGLMTRYRSGQAGAVATVTGYRFCNMRPEGSIFLVRYE
jgi:hypothetical protein